MAKGKGNNPNPKPKRWSTNFVISIYRRYTDDGETYFDGIYLSGGNNFEFKERDAKLRIGI